MLTTLLTIYLLSAALVGLRLLFDRAWVWYDEPGADDVPYQVGLAFVLIFVPLFNTLVAASILFTIYEGYKFRGELKTVPSRPSHTGEPS